MLAKNTYERCPGTFEKQYIYLILIRSPDVIRNNFYGVISSATFLVAESKPIFRCFRTNEDYQVSKLYRGWESLPRVSPDIAGRLLARIERIVCGLVRH